MYAALAADVLGDIDGLDDEELPLPPPPPPLATNTNNFPNVAAASTITAAAASATVSAATAMVESPQPLYLTTTGPAGHSQRQILVAAPSGALTSRVSIMGAAGQQYFVTPQTALVQVCVFFLYIFVSNVEQNLEIIGRVKLSCHQ